jgi:hypothetical protein
MGTLYEDVFTFMTSGWILFRIKNISNKDVEKIETHILYSVTFSGKLWRLPDNVEKYGVARGRRWQYGVALVLD